MNGHPCREAVAAIAAGRMVMIDTGLGFAIGLPAARIPVVFAAETAVSRQSGGIIVFDDPRQSRPDNDH